MNTTIVVTCLLIIIARIADVSLGTLRTVMVVSGLRTWSFVLGFLEVLIWITVVSRIIGNLDHWSYYFAYAFGFATGNVVGITLEQRLAFGIQIVRVFSRRSHEIATALRASGIGGALPQLAVTEMEAKGHKGPVGVLLVEVPRRFASKVAARAIELDPDAYFIIDDVRRSSTAAARTGKWSWKLAFAR